LANPLNASLTLRDNLMSSERMSSECITSEMEMIVPCRNARFVNNIYTLTLACSHSPWRWHLRQNFLTRLLRWRFVLRRLL
jgi:hypothetical protein